MRRAYYHMQDFAKWTILKWYTRHLNYDKIGKTFFMTFSSRTNKSSWESYQKYYNFVHESFEFFATFASWLELYREILVQRSTLLIFKNYVLSRLRPLIIAYALIKIRRWRMKKAFNTCGIWHCSESSFKMHRGGFSINSRHLEWNIGNFEKTTLKLE